MTDFASVLEAPWFLPLVGVAGLALAIPPLLLARRQSRLCYAIWATRFVTPVGRAPKSRRRRRNIVPATVESAAWVSIWSEAPDALKGTDIAARNPLRVVVLNGEVLPGPGTHLGPSTDDAIGWETTVKNGSLCLSFDLLNPGEGAVFRVRHSNPNPWRVEVRGTLANVGHPVRVADPSSLGGVVSRYGWLAYILLGVVVSAMGVLIFGPESRVLPEMALVWVVGDAVPAYAASRYSDIRLVVPKALRDASVGLPELKDARRIL